MKKSIYSSVIKYAFVPFVLLILLDIFDVPSRLGIYMNNINDTLLGAVFSAFVVVVLYIISYEVINKRQITKDENAKKTAIILILASYKKCLRYLQMIDNHGVLEQFIIPKIDFNKSHAASQIVVNIQDQPFMEHNKIIDMAASGALEENQLDAYLKIADAYKAYISDRITFFDIDYAYSDHIDLRKQLSQNKETLYSSISKEQEKLELLLDGGKMNV